MRAVIVTFFLLVLLGLTAFVQVNILPFSVKVGGQEATAAPGADHAVVAQPVAANAALEFGASGMVIVNIVKSSPEAQPVAGTPTIVIVAQNAKTSLDQSVSKQELVPGTYLMNAVAAGKTARVVFSVK